MTSEDKRLIDEYMKQCELCPRKCTANRLSGKKGFCGTDAAIKVSRAALHMWEEPCISGAEGSGAVFFSGCSLRCIFCQNQEISRGRAGKEITVDRLAKIFLELQGKGANNINLVTACHYIPQVAAALKMAKESGLNIPVLYNSSGYELPESLRLLEGLVDIWLPDFKYMNPETAAKYSMAKDYPEVAKAALAEMVRQARKKADENASSATPDLSADAEETGAAQLCVFDERGMIRSGVIVRHLLLPGHVKESKQVLKYLHETYGDEIYISIMSQYTPMPEVAEDPLLSRRVTEREYERLIDYAVDLGIENGFTQEREVAKDSFIPSFDGEGVLDGKEDSE